jgi:hypothetical protein
MMMSMRSIARNFLLGATLLVGCMSVAVATVIPANGTKYTFNLTNADVGSGLVNGPFGTVTLTQAADEVDVTVALAAGYLFANTGNDAVTDKHHAFVFNLGAGFSNAKVTLLSLTSIFKVGYGATFPETPWGTFNRGIDFKVGAARGLSGAVAGPIQFKVQAANLSINNFVSNGTGTGTSTAAVGNLFSADIGNACTTLTGNVATPGNAPHTTHVPEPGTIALLGLGLLGACLARRRRS